jgi:DNA-binding MarR family transcriptional regulator
MSDLFNNFQKCLFTRASRLSRQLAEIYRQEIKDTGFSESQMSILFYLSASGETYQRDLGEYLHLERSTVSRDLRRLVEQQLIHKTPVGISPVLQLTQKGKNAVKKLTPRWRAAQRKASRFLGKDKTNWFLSLTE